MRKRIRIGCWNVNGLKKKIGRADFREELTNLDFIACVETWTTREFNVKVGGYKHLHLVRPKRKRAGRHSGGIVFYYNDQYEGSVELLSSESSNIADTLWVKIDKSAVGHNRDIIVGVVYVAPNSSGRDKAALDGIEGTVAELSHSGGCYSCMRL
jgi:exonuclease III